MIDDNENEPTKLIIAPNLLLIQFLFPMLMHPPIFGIDNVIHLHKYNCSVLDMAQAFDSLTLLHVGESLECMPVFV